MDIRIIPYKAEHQPAFRELNLHWLEKYGLTEEYDLRILEDPRRTILDKGGYIWMAEADGEIVGSAGLALEEPGVYELVKMTVASAYQGQGISRLLIERCLYKARELGARKVTLYSNHQLARAIGLYEKYGFRHVELVNSPLETADVRMELELQAR
jgi:N-acetylglutamate synthase-like GNAT family acetyltransferase